MFLDSKLVSVLEDWGNRGQTERFQVFRRMEIVNVPSVPGFLDPTSGIPDAAVNLLNEAPDGPDFH